MFGIFKDIIALQKGYGKLRITKTLTKKNICNLCIPFRDKYRLSSLDTLRLARNKLSINDIVSLMEKALPATYSMRKWVVIRPTDSVIVTIMQNKGDKTYSFVNLTKNHICTCRFATIKDALKDLECRKQDGSVIDYYEIG